MLLLLSVHSRRADGSDSGVITELPSKDPSPLDRFSPRPHMCRQTATQAAALSCSLEKHQHSATSSPDSVAPIASNTLQTLAYI